MPLEDEIKTYRQWVFAKPIEHGVLGLEPFELRPSNRRDFRARR